VKSIRSSHSRRSSLSRISNNLEVMANRRSSLLLNKRKLSLQKITEDNRALLDRINAQRPVVSFKKPEEREKVTMLRFFHTNKENLLEGKRIDTIISRRTQEIDKALEKKRPQVLYLF
jgi:hypothetical protein